MTFTDDDLKKLEAFIWFSDKGKALIGDDFIVEAKLESLIARLEAAEAICDHAWNTGAYPPIPDERWTAWRKAAGK